MTIASRLGVGCAYGPHDICLVRLPTRSRGVAVPMTEVGGSGPHLFGAFVIVELHLQLYPLAYVVVRQRVRFFDTAPGMSVWVAWSTCCG